MKKMDLSERFTEHFALPDGVFQLLFAHIHIHIGVGLMGIDGLHHLDSQIPSANHIL